jgi:hypothetical protein
MWWSSPKKDVDMLFIAVNSLLHLQSSVMLKQWGWNYIAKETVFHWQGGENISVASSSQTTTVSTVHPTLLLLGPYREPDHNAIANHPDCHNIWYEDSSSKAGRCLDSLFEGLTMKSFYYLILSTAALRSKCFSFNYSLTLSHQQMQRFANTGLEPRNKLLNSP